jgi:phosphatidylglycerophosphatase A
MRLPNIMSGRREPAKTVKKFLITALATGMGLGYLPLIPGTFGTLAGIPICLLLNLGGWVVYALGSILLIVAGVWIAAQAEDIFGVHDSRRVVVDEICGFLVTMAFVVPGVLTIAIGFIAFRFFDIVKPFPVGYLDKNVPGGWGVMLDDIAAGVYANVTLRICLAIIHLVRPGIL